MPISDTLIAFVASRPADESAADTLAAWLADVTTVRPIPLKGLEAALNTAGLLVRLRQIADAGTLGQENTVRLASFLKHVDSPRQTEMDTTDPEVAGQAVAILGLLVEAKEITAQKAAAILALGGGPRHDPAATEQDVADARAIVARRAAYDALNNARFAADAERQAKLNYLTAHPDVPLPADLAALDAWEIPGGEG